MTKQWISFNNDYSLKEELVLTWLVQQKTTDTIEQVSLLLLIYYLFKPGFAII